MSLIKVLQRDMEHGRLRQVGHLHESKDEKKKCAHKYLCGGHCFFTLGNIAVPEIIVETEGSTLKSIQGPSVEVPQKSI